MTYNRILGFLGLALVSLLTFTLAAGLDEAQRGAPSGVREAVGSVVTLYAERPEQAGMVAIMDGAEPVRGSSEWHWRSGSAFAFAEEGWLLTNYHVVADARRIEAVLPDGQRIPARLHAIDQNRDLAVIQLEGVSLRPLRPGRLPDLGDQVWAIGAPFDLSGTLSTGIISGFDRAYDGIDPIDYLQHDAAINPGNSGGPLLDARGRVIGINTAIAEPAIMNVGIGFAIPADIAFAAAEELREHGYIPGGYLGVTVRSLEPSIAEALGVPSGQGLILDSVDDNSPAALAGLRAGDVLVEADEMLLSAPRDLSRLLLSVERDDPMALVWYRDGARMESHIMPDITRQGPGRIPDDIQSNAPSDFGFVFSTDQDEDEGVLIATTRPGSPASLAGLGRGDSVLAINGHRAIDAIEAELRLSEAENSVALLVRRQGEVAARHLGLARTGGQVTTEPGARWPHAAGGPY